MDSNHFLWTLHTFWQIYMHQKCWTTSNRVLLPSEYRQIMGSSICLTFIVFRRCKIININTDSLRFNHSYRPSLYQFYSQKNSNYHITDRLNLFENSVEFDILFLGPLPRIRFTCIHENIKVLVPWKRDRFPDFRTSP